MFPDDEDVHVPAEVDRLPNLIGRNDPLPEVARLLTGNVAPVTLWTIWFSAMSGSAIGAPKLR